jgi:hypothetical protein
MNFTDNNPLSMTGEDSFTSINQILQRCVLIDTNQTILSSKTFEATTTTIFDGDVELNSTTDNTGVLNNTGTLIVGGTLNLNTDIIADKASLNFTNTGSTLINPSNILALQIAGNDKFVTDAMNTAISATSTMSFSAGGSTNTQFNSANFQNNFGTQQQYQVNNATKLLLANTATTLNNTTTNIQSGGTNKITTNANTTTLNNETTNIQSNGTNRITINPTTTGLDNTTTNIQSGGTTKIQTTGTTTTLNNDTTYIQSGAVDKIEVTATQLNLTNATISAFSGGVVDPKYRQTATQSIIDNDTIRMRYRTADRLVQTATDTTITNTNIATNGILTQTGSATIKGATITLQDATPTTKYLQTSTNTTITNGFIVSNATTEQRIQVNGGDKFISIVGSTSIQDVIMGVSSTSGGLFLSSSSGKITMDTNNTSTDGILIKNINTGAGGVRIESDGATGTLALDSAGTLNANTSTGKNSLSSTTGQIELRTGAGTNTGINIENTSVTDGGITLRTTGTTGDIILSSGDDITINTRPNSGGNITIEVGTLSTATGLLRLDANNGTIEINSANISVGPSYFETTYSIYTPRYRVGNFASSLPLLSFSVLLVKRGTATSGQLLFQPQESANTTNPSDFQIMPCHVKFLRWVVNYDNDSGTNTTMSFTFQSKIGNAGSISNLHTETFGTDVSSTRTNTQGGNINSGVGVDYRRDVIMGVNYSGAPANEFGVILYAQQID